MIKHIVFFKLKNNSAEVCRKAKEILLSMDGKVEMIKEIEVGVDFLHSARSYDLALEVVLEDAAALDAYQIHPYHHDVVRSHMLSVSEISVTVDFEI